MNYQAHRHIACPSCHSHNCGCDTEDCTRVCGPVEVEGSPTGLPVSTIAGCVEWSVAAGVTVGVAGPQLLLPAQHRVKVVMQNHGCADLMIGPSAEVLQADGGIMICKGQALELPEGYCGDVYVMNCSSVSGQLLVNEFRVEGAS